MDINLIKKYVQGKIDSDKQIQNIRNKIISKRWKNQDLKEGFKEPFKPFLKSNVKLVESIEKESDKNIEQLQKNQITLTKGLLDNKFTLEQELKKLRKLLPGAEEAEELEEEIEEEREKEERSQRAEKAAEERIKESARLGKTLRPGEIFEAAEEAEVEEAFGDLDASFNDNDIIWLEKNNYLRPSNFYYSNKETLDELYKKVNIDIKKKTGEINGYNRKKKKTEYDKERINNLRLIKKILFDYKNILSIAIGRFKKKIGSGLYFNPIHLIKRLDLLAGSILAGNNGVIPEFSQIAHLLKQMKMITPKQLNDLLKIYVSIK